MHLQQRLCARGHTRQRHQRDVVPVPRGLRLRGGARGDGGHVEILEVAAAAARRRRARVAFGRHCRWAQEEVGCVTRAYEACLCEEEKGNVFPRRWKDRLSGIIMNVS